ncbi:GNAT family N-acetyltransferase [soil metagenome]
MLKIGPTTIAAVTEAPSFLELAAEYAAESQIKGLPPPTTDMTAYRRLEAAGLLHAFSATVDGELAGFLTLLVALHPRYAVPLATSESHFVGKAHRKTGAGLKLLAAAEAKAREMGTPGLLVSAPLGGSLAEVLPRRGFSETNRVFFKGFAND